MTILLLVYFCNFFVFFFKSAIEEGFAEVSNEMDNTLNDVTDIKKVSSLISISLLSFCYPIQHISLFS